MHNLCGNKLFKLFPKVKQLLLLTMKRFKKLNNYCTRYSSIEVQNEQQKIDVCSLSNHFDVNEPNNVG